MNLYRTFRELFKGGWHFHITPEEFEIICTMDKHEDVVSKVWWFNHLYLRRN